MNARLARSLLYAALAVGLVSTARAATPGLFGVRASFEPTHFVLEMRIPALCLRLQGEIPGFIVATAHLLACDACGAAQRARSWS